MTVAIILAGLITILFLHIILSKIEKVKLTKKLPGPKNWIIIGHMLEVLVTPVELFQLCRKYASRYNGIYGFWTFHLAAVNIYNPNDVEAVVSSLKHHEKSNIYTFLAPWLRNGLLLSSGEKWQKRRKILTPAFHFNILRQFFTILQENSRKLTDILAQSTGEPIDVIPVLSEFTLHSICETAMGTKLNNSKAAKSYKKAIYEIGPVFVYRLSRIVLRSDSIFYLTKFGSSMKRHLRTVHEFTMGVINERKEYIDKNGIDIAEDDDDKSIRNKRKIAMLDLLIMAEKDGLIDSNGIQEEVDTFMFEGHDTTSSGLIYCVMSLANYPQIQEKVAAELHDIFGVSKRPPTNEDLTRMNYLDCCIKESLRLYPPVPFISRTISETVQLSNYKIAAGTSCHIHIYDLHRHEKYFKNPLTFEPDRFLPENSEGRHPYAYIPFSAGPRNCIGQKFAMMEMKLALSAILREYILLPVTKPVDIHFNSDIVLRNTEPVYVTFVKRKIS